MSEQSYLVAGKDGKLHTYVGPEAMKAFKLITLASALKLWAVSGIIPTRGFGITKMLALATGYTGKPYTRKQAEIAANDCATLADLIKAGLPVHAS